MKFIGRKGTKVGIMDRSPRDILERARAADRMVVVFFKSSQVDMEAFY